MIPDSHITQGDVGRARTLPLPSHSLLSAIKRACANIPAKIVNSQRICCFYWKIIPKDMCFLPVKGYALSKYDSGVISQKETNK